MRSEVDTVPFDGVWAARVDCYRCTLPGIDDLQVVDAEGEVVAGTYRLVMDDDAAEWSSGFITWMPTEPLIEGESYAVHLADHVATASPPAPIEFSAGPSVQSELPLNNVRTLLDESFTYAGPEHCCAELENSCGGSCTLVATEATRHITATLVWTPPDGPDHDQYAYRGVFADGDETIETPWSLTTRVSQELPDGDRTVCVEIMAKDLVMEQVSLAFDGCIDLAEAETIGKKAAIESQLRLGLGVCSDPGEFKDTWCDLFEEARETGDCTDFWGDGCEASLSECSTTDIGQGGSNNSTSDPQSDDDSTDSTNESDDDSTGSKNQSDGSSSPAQADEPGKGGCQYADSHRAPQGLPKALLLLLLLVGCRRLGSRTPRHS